MIARLFLLLALLLPARVYADPRDSVAEARQRFQEGAELVKRAQWAEALAAFEASAKLRPHAITTYNVAACERALGRYTRARKLFLATLAMSEREGGALPESLRTEVTGLVAELDRLLVRLDVELRPAEAAFGVDGRPLERAGEEDGRPVLVADTLEPAAAEPPPSGRFVLVLDPGQHLLTLSRKGFADTIVNRRFTPGTRAPLVLEIDRLPATLHIAATVPGAVVAVNDLDVGVAPVELSRPAGSYRLMVRRRGYAPYQTQIVVNAGEEASLRANLQPLRPSVVKKWWFWTAAGALVTGVALGAYFGARAAQAPTIDGGGLGWAVKLR
jgi:hypothetical protein